MILALVIFAPPISPSERFSFAKATVELANLSPVMLPANCAFVIVPLREEVG